jgi:hypothetical protein
MKRMFPRIEDAPTFVLAASSMRQFVSREIPEVSPLATFNTPLRGLSCIILSIEDTSRGLRCIILSIEDASRGLRCIILSIEDAP